MSDADTELAAALAALTSDDDELALERLVAAWDHCRAPALVGLVDILASRIEPRYKALTGKTAEDRYQAFLATFARTRQGDLARLVAVLPKLAYGAVSDALERLLYHWPCTPRMRTLLASVALPGYSDRIEELCTVHATPRHEPLSDRALAIVAELQRLLTSTDDTGAELLAQVYADPDADAPRLVYADWATSRGDPRGELISLQFARRARTPDQTAVRRERELLAQYEHRWLAPVWHALRAEGVRFERGFLAAATVEPFAVISPHDEWATVTALELAYHETVPMEAFPALRELRNVTPKLLAQIAAAPRKLTHLGLAHEPGKPPTATLPELIDGSAFPALRSLGVWGRPEDWAWLWHTQLGARIATLEITRQPGGESPWLRARIPETIREIRVREHQMDARIERHAGSIEVSCRYATRVVPAWEYMLRFVPARTLRAARLVFPRRPKQDSLDEMERITQRSHPALERFVVDVDPFV